MSTLSVKAFSDAVKKDQKLAAELKKTTTMQEVVALAAIYGFIIDADDIQEEYSKAKASGTKGLDGDCSAGYCPW